MRPLVLRNLQSSQRGSQLVTEGSKEGAGLRTGMAGEAQRRQNLSDILIAAWTSEMGDRARTPGTPEMVNGGLRRAGVDRLWGSHPSS